MNDSNIHAIEGATILKTLPSDASNDVENLRHTRACCGYLVCKESVRQSEFRLEMPKLRVCRGK